MPVVPKKSSSKTDPLRFARPSPEPARDWRALVAEAAYYRAERRGFAPGHEAEDWAAAEAEVAGQSQQGSAYAVKTT